MPLANNELWVGKHNPHGIVVIPKQAPRSDDSVAVFFLKQHRVAICVRSVINKNITNEKVSEEEIRKALESYKDYEKKVGFDTGNIELLIEHQEKEKENKRFLAALGRTQTSIRMRDQKLPIRTPNCWACKKALDSNSNWECAECGWILCQCGACGCGRH